MKIALVHEYLTNMAGSEQVLLALHELFPDAPIYTAIYNSERCQAFNKADIRTSFINKLPFAKTRYQVYIPLLPLAVEGYDLSDYDLVISDSHIAAKGVITKPESVHVCYCHTPIRYAWSADVDPRSSGSWLRRLASHYLRIWDTFAAKRVDYWIANSSYIAKRIEKYYRTQATVIHPPAAIEAIPFNPKLETEDYYIYFGRLIDYKYPDLVVKAFNQLGKRLIILGRGPMLEELQKIAGPTIEFITDYLSYEEIGELFGKAAAMIYPAEEDFGINMVEMMAAGRPVIAYGAGGALDIVKPGKTGELFTEQSVDAIINAVATFDPLRYDKKVIRSAAESFSKDHFKRMIVQYLEQITGKPIPYRQSEKKG
jgi:glycosyltransferase involved in cell wall biosynthesis